MKKMFNVKSIFLLILTVSFIVLCSCGESGTFDSTEMNTAVKEDFTTNDKAGSSGDTIGTVGETATIKTDAKIIRTFTISSETKDFDSAISTITEQLSKIDGYVEKANISGGESLYNDRRTEKRASYVLRVPAEKVDDFLKQAEGILNITSSTESSTDVTLDYYDIESRLKTLESKKNALEEMLEQAKTIDEILLIQDNLYTVISDIESYKSRINIYDSKVNYSTVNLEIVEVVEYTDIQDSKITFGERIVKAFKNSWKNFGESMQDFTVFIVSAIPTLLVLLLIAAIIILIVYFSNRKKADKKPDEKTKK